MLSKETFEINSTEHRKAQRISKIRNLAKGNKNPAEKAAAERKAGGPKLVGENQQQYEDFKQFPEKKVSRKIQREKDYLDGKFEVDRQDAMGNYISPEKRDKKKGIKKVKKESFSNWREENLTEHGNKNKPGYVNIGMGIWVKKEDAEKKKAQLAKSVRGKNIPGFKGGRLD